MRKSALILAILGVHFLAMWGMAVNRRAIRQDEQRLAQASQSAPTETHPAQTRPTPAAATAPSAETAPDSTYEEYMRHRQESAATNEQAENGVEAVELGHASPFSLQLNLDYTTAYFYHGILQEDSGLILQPSARLTINLYSEDDFKIDAILGTWNSFHGEKTNAHTDGDFTNYWYESDLIAGFAITKGDFSLTTTYTFLTSPSNAYQTVQELDFTLAYDDSRLLGGFAMHPYTLLGIETGADYSDGADSDKGIYLELGIAPGFSFDIGKTPIAVSFPASVGLSLHNYYQNTEGDDDTFGFAQVGAKAAIPLPFGDRFGSWTLNAGVSALFLGDHTAEFNHNDDFEVIGVVGLQLNF
ncbi:MAG TPA: hypothetical protein VG711_09020 [Phycisphaerales bacterium]|nr:hypothetical protein [Phycisphaerales bacterium]